MMVADSVDTTWHRSRTPSVGTVCSGRLVLWQAVSERVVTGRGLTFVLRRDPLVPPDLSHSFVLVWCCRVPVLTN